MLVIDMIQHHERFSKVSTKEFTELELAADLSPNIISSHVKNKFGKYNLLELTRKGHARSCYA